MADPNQYKYTAMSNLVLKADKRFQDRRVDDVTGDPESLAGKISLKDMGGRVARDAAPKEKMLKKKARLEENRSKRIDVDAGADILAREQRKRKRDVQLGGSSILAATDDVIANLSYHPRTNATRETFGLILTLINNILGDVPHTHVRSAADAVLEILKDTESGKKDFDKKKEIEELLGEQMDNKRFNELVNLGKKITDYGVEEDEQAAREGEDEEDIDEQNGVAVIFGSEDEDEDEGEYEVREGDDDSEDEDADDEEKKEGEEEKEEAADDEEMIIGGGADDKDTKKETESVPAHLIDAFWLQRQVATIFTDPHTASSKTQEIFDVMSASEEEVPRHQKENDLFGLFDYENNEMVQLLFKNMEKIVWCTKLARAEEKDKAEVQKQMVEAGFGYILEELRRRDGGVKKEEQTDSGDKMDVDEDVKQGKGALLRTGLMPRKVIELENLVFEQGSHLMSNPSVKLPQGSTKRTFKGYEEIHVPAPKKRSSNDGPKNIPITDMPQWAQTPFTASGSKFLNPIQTRCFPMAFEDDGNMLVCAPTGSGKTNVAMLTILREIGKHIDPQTGRVRLDEFKIVYIAPLKALVQEQVGNFGKRLEPYGIKVSELTGDRQLTKQQIVETQIIVTTPEKWDVITRKATDLSYTNLVRLIIIDEIHLLHDERGPVLESIVSRTIRKTEQTLEDVRIVGLSATLPNYKDVATFLQVDTTKGLFHFDASYRPCPLKQEFIGVSDKKPIKQLQAMNDVCYKKVIEQAAKNQMLIFVHSRKETGRTAKYIRDKAVEEETINQILNSEAAIREILQTEQENVSDPNLKDLLPYGFAIHHAGMSRADRTTVEDLFAEGAIQVLVCTATLAWGVNLPAHTVIIKGTQIYSPEKGSWVELSPQDVLQMLGRAGRPQFDTYGEGIIITTATEMQYYLSLLNQQLPIESQFMRKLVDNLNAEIVLGTVRTRDEAVEWLGYTYLYVRMLRSPGLYSVGAEYADDDALEQKRVDLIHSAAVVLERNNLIKYDKVSGRFQSTELGRISSHYYISHTSIATYNQHLQSALSPIELFRVFALSEEFKYIPVRQEEKVELAKLLQRVPIPVKETIDEPQAKINVLLQAYISRLKLEGLALMADMVYVTQSAGRILRAIFEICLRKGWANVAKTALDLCKMAEKRMWPTMTPLRQFPGAPREVITKLERIGFHWESLFHMDPPTIGQALDMHRQGKTVHALLERFPRLEVQAQVQPITRSMLRVELTITPNFVWDDNIHGPAEAFWILVEDVDGEEILFHEQFILKRQYAISENNEHLIDFTVPMVDPMPPNYFISVVSDRWMHSETKLAISFRKLILPEKFSPHTKLQDRQPVPVHALKRPEYVNLYKNFGSFNRIQTQVFDTLYNKDDSVFIGAPTGSGKTVCAELALLKHWKQEDAGRAVYIAPLQELVDQRYADWKRRFKEGVLGSKDVVKLTGETAADLKLLEQGDLILATPAQWDTLSRQWQRRKNVQAVELFIADELHMLGSQNGFLYEVIVSRMQYIAVQTERPLRMIGLSTSLANARDIGEWIGANSHTIFNFRPQDRPTPLEIHIQSYSVPHFPSLMLAMTKPAYIAIQGVPQDKPAIVFLPSRKQVRATALDLFQCCQAEEQEEQFLNVEVADLRPYLDRIQEVELAESLSHGIGYFHEALSKNDKRIVTQLFEAGAFKVMLASREVAWELENPAHLVIVMGTQFFEGKEHRYIDYSIAEVLQMFGHATMTGADKFGKAILMTPASKKSYYRKFLNEALPMESHLQVFLHDAFVAEISTKTIASTQDAVDWLTYSYFYRRLLANPSYYSLTDTSHDGLSAFLSELVENTLKDLVEAKMIDLDEEDDSITPLNASMIAAYYNISFVTMQTFLLSLTAKTKLKGILEIISFATEFEAIPIRRHEESVLRKIYSLVPVKQAAPSFESPHFKAFILLQAHFSRLVLPADLASDQALVLGKVLGLLSACVDVLSSEGHLNAMGAMEMSQMCVQAMWDRDSPLKQIPGFGEQEIEIATEAGINDILEFMDMMSPDNPSRNDLLARLNLDGRKLAQAAKFTNEKYPNIAELEYEIEDEEDIHAGSPAYIKIHIERDLDDEDEDKEVDMTVHAPFYPKTKIENWWLVLALPETKTLLAIRRVTVGRKLDVRLEFTVPEEGEKELKLYLMCDSYVGVDQEHEVRVKVLEGEESESEEEGEGDVEMSD
ncbi:pre-mRNA splicing factor [Ascobolus immersus RN42]|uniref:Pre-mRNA splicing factor n=1 Tax=Ascobolus immersus RN42 TaxID=1160509 RepID=A0A3N4HSH6_ASCIM|nr:pre-mRNA splicing factor [Ascobolus immersus RN42]